MKHKFTKYLGRITENLEIGLEEKWIYVHYTKGSIEKTACLLKNENKSEEAYLEAFLEENKVSEEMRKEIKTFFKNGQSQRDKHWNESTNFLMKAVSLNMVFGIAIAISVFAGYKLGDLLDNRYDIYPVFTLIGIFLGIGVGGATVYSLVHKYFLTSQKNEVPEPKEEQIKDYPIIEVSIDEVRKAVRTFSDNLPKGAYRTILVKEDHSIDFNQLAPILGGVPSKNFYMSKETYDLFEENEKQIPIEMDIVQKAVDQYVKDHKEFPMLKFDPQHRVNYYQLLQDHYLKKAPEIQFYLTDLDGLITHIKPKKKNSSLS
ncbi:F0F1-type ATP synthase assembly protein I [Bacillus sp. SLBN-46]|jgi:F0F1-type ATP synthase assembly protein I|uniref:AtpZ/AtpI family protein n=1 Tax=Bacillus sp. SLBN-46 TaxID=3042283 RepID=UPI0028654472|nr:AtpZ/AtpI family protein [Bacillus sp. SLBN-46]MDR6124699.1 F0F1-type ATP synthase assembly protein I [Bacillus sp. SLBN-46]